MEIYLIGISIILLAILGYICFILKRIDESIAEFHTAACTRLEDIKNIEYTILERDYAENNE